MRGLAAAALALLVCVGASWAQEPRARAQGPERLDWPQQESDLSADPAVRYGRLENGLRYAILVNHTPSRTASVRLRFNFGSLMEAEDEMGLAHFLEHMAFNGSAGIPENELVPLLQRHGLTFGADANAFTSYDQTVYTLDAPNLNGETLDTIFFLLREMSTNLTLSQVAVERERGVVLSEARSRDTPAYRAQRARWNYLFPGTRFAARPVLGSLEVIAQANAARLRTLYETYYRPERAYLVIVGDVDPAAIETRIRDTFGSWRAARPDAPQPPLGSVTTPAAPSHYFYDPGLTTNVTLSVTGTDPVAPDTRAEQRQARLRGFGNAIVGRRLATLARSPDAVFQSGGASFSRLFDTAELAEVQINTRPEDWPAALAVGEQELRRALENGFTQPELDEQLASLRNALRNATAAAPTRTNSALASSLITHFNTWRVFRTPADAQVTAEEELAAVTPQAVAEAFRAAWRNEQRAIVLTTNREVATAADEIARAYEASRATAVTGPVAISTTPFAYTRFGRRGRIAQQRVIEDVGITVVRFANNVRLNLKHTDFAENSISVSVRVGAGGLELPKTQPGLGLAFGALREGGLVAHSADELQHILVGRTVGANVGVGADAFLYSGATTPADLQLTLQVLASYLTAPGYRPEGMALFRRTIQRSYQTLSATPNGVLQRDAARLVRSNDPRFGIPPLADIDARSYDEVRAALARATGRGAIEIAIVGDVDIAAAITLVAETFGALPVRELEAPPFTEARVVAFPAPTAAPVVLRHEGTPNRAAAQVYWPSVDDTDVRKVRTIELLRAILSQKLTDQLREAEGATYGAAAQALFSRINPGYGYILASADLAPGNIDGFFRSVDTIAEQMAAGGISDDDLERARRPMLEEIRRALENNGYWRGLVAVAQSDPERLARHRTLEADLRVVTVADLTAAAREYLRPERAYRIAVLPPEATPPSN